MLIVEQETDNRTIEKKTNQTNKEYKEQLKYN